MTLKDIADKLKQGLTNAFNATPFASPTANNGQNFWGNSKIAQGMGNFQNYIQSPAVTNPFPTIPTRQNDNLPMQIGKGILNIPSGIGNTIVGKGILAPTLDMGTNLGKLVTGQQKTSYDQLLSPASRLGYQIGGGYQPTDNVDRLKQTFGNLAGIVEPIATAYLPKGVAGIATKPTLAKSTIEGAIQGAKFGGVFGGIQGLSENRDTKNNGEYALRILGMAAGGAGMGAVLGGATGGVAGLIDKIIMARNPQMTVKEVQTARNTYLRDESGRFQGRVANKKEPVYYGDIRESFGMPRTGLKSKDIPMGLSVKKLTKAEHYANVANGKLYDTKFYHGTSSQNAELIKKTGFKIGNTANAKDFGEGIYITPSRESASRYGGTTLETTVKPNLKVKSVDVPYNITKDQGKALADQAKKEGFEALRIKHPDLGESMVVFDPKNVNVAQQPLSEVTRGNLSNPPVGDLQKGNLISGQQSVGEVPTRTMANQEVSSPNIISDKGKLNINKLNVQGAGKEVLLAQEANIKPTIIGNKQVVDMARTAKGTGTMSDETMKKLMSQQLKNRQVVVDLTEQFNNAKKSGATDVELAKIMLNIADQSNTARQGGTFAGRLLQAQNILADQSASPMQKIFALLDNAGADKGKYVKDAVKVNWDNPTEVVNFYRKYVPPKFGEILDEIRYSNMLSSPLTHIVNTVSNALQTGVIAPIEKTITGTLDFGKSALTGSERQYYARSGIDYAGGYIKALPDAFKKAYSVMSGEQILVKPDYERIPTGTKGLLSAYTTPLKALEAMDQFFKTLVESGVTNELKKGPQKLTMTQISSNATKEANYRLFRQAFDPNGELGSGIVLKTFDKWNSAIANLRRLPGGKWVLPFLQTPTNILKQGVEYSPLGVSTMVGAKAPIEQLSKSIIGTGVFMGAYGLAKSGLTTWDAPASGTERDLFYSAGMQPYAVKIGNNWVSYSKLGPLSYPIAMAAALANAERKNPDKRFINNVGKGVSGILGFFGDQSYVRSIGDLVDAIRGGGNMGSTAFTSEAANLTGQLIPYHSFLTWLGRLTDPTYRKATTFVDKLKKDLPVLGGGLKPYTDLQGNPSKRDYPALNAVSPYQMTKQKLPEAKMLFDVQTKKIQNDVSKRADEAFLAGDTSQQITGNIYRYVDDKGAVQKIDLSFPIKEYKPTGNETLDKELLSDYKGSITTAKNNVMKAWEVGAITQDEAIKQLESLVSKANATKKPKKPAKVTFKYTAPKAFKMTVSRGIKKKLPTIKFSKPKIKKSTIKTYRIKA